MGSKNCMNEACRTTTSSEWKKGWSLKSGGFATLCDNCGLSYDNSIFCETFHFKESGWRECRICGKIIHCGCASSRYQYEYMDFGGISCLSCAKHLEIQPVQPVQTPGDLPSGTFMTNGVKDVYPLVTENKRNDDTLCNRIQDLIQMVSSGKSASRTDFASFQKHNMQEIQGISSQLEQMTNDLKSLKLSITQNQADLILSQTELIAASHLQVNSVLTLTSKVEAVDAKISDQSSKTDQILDCMLEFMSWMKTADAKKGKLREAKRRLKVENRRRRVEGLSPIYEEETEDLDAEDIGDDAQNLEIGESSGRATTADPSDPSVHFT